MRYIQEQHCNTDNLQIQYKNNKPFPHIVLDNFIQPDFIERVLTEFPDLSLLENKKSFNICIKYTVVLLILTILNFFIKEN